MDQPELEQLIGLGSDLLISGQSIRVRVGGISMFPALKKGDEVIVLSKKNFSKVEIGDVLVFQSGGRMIAHRFLKMKRNTEYYITKGDSCMHPDPPFSINELLGKIISYERNGAVTEMDSPGMRRFNKVMAFISPFLPPFYRVYFITLTILRRLRNIQK